MKSDKVGPQSATLSGAPGRHHLYRQTVLALGVAGFALVIFHFFAAKVATLGPVSALTSVAIYLTAGGIVLARILDFHPYSVFGWPNTITLLRTVLAALVAGYTAEISLWTLAPSAPLAWTFAVIASIAVILDGVDGWLARRIGPRSAFGARFDMESDAFLIMTLSVLAVVLGKVGFWVLLIGGMRYLFVGASYVFPWLDRPLPESMRRKAICAVQAVALCLLAMPGVHGVVAAAIAAAALALIVFSFAVDTLWLHRNRERVGADGEVGL